MLSFHYYPSARVAQAITGLYAIMTIVSIVQCYRFRSSCYMWTVPVMAFVETAGYGLRMAVAQKWSVPLYVNSQLFLLLAPIALAVVNYIVVGRIMRAVGRNVGWLKPNFIARLFLASDILVRHCSDGNSQLCRVALNVVCSHNLSARHIRPPRTQTFVIQSTGGAVQATAGTDANKAVRALPFASLSRPHSPRTAKSHL